MNTDIPAELIQTGLAYSRSENLLADACSIIDSARKSALRSVNAALVYRNWLLGRRIAEEELGGESRADYGKRVIASLADQLTSRYGPSFDASNLYKFHQFFRLFPILDSLCLKSGAILSWSHYRTLLQVPGEDSRKWYMEEAGSESWGVRTLQRNISSQYYERTWHAIRCSTEANNSSPQNTSCCYLPKRNCARKSRRRRRFGSNSTARSKWLLATLELATMAHWQHSPRWTRCSSRRLCRGFERNRRVSSLEKNSPMLTGALLFGIIFRAKKEDVPCC